MFRKILKIAGLFSLLLALGAPAWGGETRNIPIDMYLIVDSSSAMEQGKDEAIAWLCSAVIDGMLQNGDRIWVWTAGEKPELIYSGDLNKEAVKTALRAVRFRGSRADYRGALEEAAGMLKGGNRTTYTLLVSGSGPKDPPSQEAESAGFLQYSRVEHFSGWRVLTVGLDLAPKIRRASSWYTANR